MVFNAIFNNISVILWRTVLLVEETGLSQVTDKLYHIIYEIFQVLDLA
jgi:alkyl sulfatase BDS1-like metallo-beta-lactamase superfamily hydrolase